MESVEKRVKAFVRKLRYHPKEALYLALAMGLIAFALKGTIFDESIPFLDAALVEQLRKGVGVLGLALLLYTFYRYWKIAVPPVAPEETREIKTSVEKGASAFTENDAHIFSKLGRDAVLAKLRSWILDPQIPFIAIQGESGAGKTSLLRAGLSLTLAKDEAITLVYWEASPVQPEQGLLKAVCTQLKLDANTAVEAGGDIAEFLLQHFKQHKLVVVIDQFEQLKQHQHPVIFTLLNKLLKTKPPYCATWVVAFRKEYTNEFWRFREQLRGEDSSADNRIEPLTVEYFRPEEAKRVLAQLLAECDTQVEQSLVEKLIESQSQNDWVSPVDIGISVQMLNRLAERQPGKTVSWEQFSAMGGESGLLKNYLEDVLSTLPQTTVEDALKLLLNLVDEDGVQRVAEGRSANDLRQNSNLENTLDTEGVLLTLASPRHRVLEMLSQGGQRFRLVHERFVPAIRQLSGIFLAEIEQLKLQLDKQFRHWAEQGNGAFLLGFKQLRIYGKYKSQLGWEQTEGRTRFINASKFSLFKQQVLSVFIAASMLAGGVLWYQFYQRAQLEHQLRTMGLPVDLFDYPDQLESLIIHDIGTFDFANIKNSKLKNLILPEIRELKNQGSVPDTLRYLSIEKTTVENIDFRASKI